MRRQILWSALAVAAVTLTAGLVAGAAISRNLVAESETELLRQAEATATLIAASVRDSVPGGDDGSVLSIVRTLEVAQAVGGHDYVEARVAGFDSTRFGRNAFPNTPLLDVLGDDPELNKIIETSVDGEPVLAYARAVDIGQRRGARVIIAIGRTEAFLSANLLLRPLLLSLGVGALLAILLSYAIARRIGRRLDKLGEASQSIAAGDFTVRAPDDGQDDVARLGQAFNEMAVRLEQARQREHDFISSVGHDLRTPLTTLRGYAEALDAGEIDADDLDRVGSVLHRQTDRLSRLVEDLSLLSRLEAREFSLRPESVDLGAHVRGLVDSQRTRAEAMHISLEVSAEDVGLLVVDPDRVDQIVGNLIDNALRYTPEGGRVTVTVVRASDGVRLVVADTGPGIDPDDLPRVFERLYVSQRYRPVRPEGSGLGLSIVKELVDAMGGSVDVSSELGRGTSVAVLLAHQPEVGLRQR